MRVSSSFLMLVGLTLAVSLESGVSGRVALRRSQRNDYDDYDLSQQAEEERIDLYRDMLERELDWARAEKERLVQTNELELDPSELAGDRSLFITNEVDGTCPVGMVWDRDVKKCGPQEGQQVLGSGGSRRSGDS